MLNELNMQGVVIMKTTASGNFETSKSWNGLRKHFEHDEKIKHKNEFLNSDESKKLRKFNQHFELENFDDWTKKHFENYVLARDEKALSKSRYVFGSVENFLKVDASGKRRKKTLDKLYIEKFSSQEDYEQIKKKAIPKIMKSRNCDKQKALNIFNQAVSDSLAKYAKDFNTRNKNLIMFEAYIHMDEEGAPHLHSRVMPFIANKDPNKKPSWSLNKVLKTKFGKTDSRQNLGLFREQEDQAMIDAVNQTFAKELPELNFNFKLERKNPAVTGVSHDVYKLHKQQEDLQKRLDEVEKREKEVAKRENSVKARESQIEPREQSLIRREHNYKQREQNLNKRENKLNEREIKVNANYNRYNIELVPKYNRKTENLNIRLNTVDQKERRLDSLISQNEQMSNELNIQIGIVQQMKNELKKITDNAKKIARNWKQNAYKLAFYTFRACEKVFRPETKERRLFDSPNNTAINQLNWYRENIMQFPDTVTPAEIDNHFANHQFSWLVSHEDKLSVKDRKILQAQNTVEKAKKLQKKGCDENNDGIDDTQEASLPTIDIASVDPMLAYNNQKEAEKEKNDSNLYDFNNKF